MKSTAALISAFVFLSGCQALQHDNVSKPTMRTSIVNGAEISYVEQGTGETVVFVHGAGTDLRIWEDVRPYIASHYRFIAYSRRHHHPNVWPDDGRSHNTNQHVEDLAEFIRVLGVGKVHVVAVSLGGQVAGRLLIRHPELVATAVLNDSLLGSPVSESSMPLMEEFDRGFLPLRTAVNAQNAEQAAAALVDWVAGESGGWTKLPESRKRYYLDNAPLLLLMRHEARFQVVCGDFGRVGVPVLVLGETGAAAAFRVTNEKLMSCLPRDAEYAVIPGAGHFWYASNPREGAEIVLRFLKKHAIDQ